MDGAASSVVTAGPAAGGEPAAGPTLSAFLTDGSIARLADELAKLTGVPIWVRDADGRVIVPGEVPGSGSGRFWHTVSAEEGLRRAFGLVGREPEGRIDLFVAPLRLKTPGAEGPVVGEIVLPADWGQDEPLRRRALERAITLLAGTAAELCRDQLALRERVAELDALFRLSSLVVKAADPGQILQAALDLALDALSADAGSVSELDDGHIDGPGLVGTPGLIHRVSKGLSEGWLARSGPISVNGELRARALAGEVIAVEDLALDPRIADHERARGEGLASLIVTGLLFQGRPLGLLRLYTRTPRSFSEQERGLLRSIADHAAMALGQARLRQLREEDQRLKRQLRTAAEVQRRMLPAKLPTVPPFDLAARYAPSFHLGGDFYDAFLRHGQLVLAVCDVVGKGVPAALLMSAVRASLRAFTQDHSDLDEVMARCNRALARDTLESEFATLWVATADPATLRLTYCAAGHEGPLVFRVPAHRPPTPADVDELSAGGMALGIDASQRYPLGRFELRPRDVLVAYTDGLPDTTDFAGQRFGKERLKRTVLDVLGADPEASPGRVIEGVLRALRSFAGVKQADDDVTIVVARVREPRTASQAESG